MNILRYLLLIFTLFTTPLHAYSVLTHEEVVDMAWAHDSVPLLKKRFPNITPEQIKEAHAYAYGGSVVQDLGYYPFGSKTFSDLLHYVRAGDLVEALLHDASTPDELAFALGALAHYTADAIGHPYVNKVTAQEFPKLERRYGDVVTYEDSPVSHVRTEFGFDVVGLVHGAYDQEEYLNFIGFEFAVPLLNRTFQETYGIPIARVLRDEELSINTCRWAVSKLIPRSTKIALLTYPDEIAKAHPGFGAHQFRFRMSRTNFEQKWGRKYKKPGIGSHIVALLIAIIPKVGPLSALNLKLPDSDQITIYLHSVNLAADAYTKQIHELAGEPPSLPLTDFNLDTGDATAAGQYKLADETYADLLDSYKPDELAAMPPELRTNINGYFSDGSAMASLKPKRRPKTSLVLANLQAAAPAIQAAN